THNRLGPLGVCGGPRMSTQYDKTIRRNLMEAFGNAVNDLIPYGGREVVDAAAECLILAMLQDLRRFVPAHPAEVLTEAFAQKIYRAVEVVCAVHTAPSRRLTTTNDETD